MNGIQPDATQDVEDATAGDAAPTFSALTYLADFTHPQRFFDNLQVKEAGFRFVINNIKIHFMLND